MGISKEELVRGNRAIQSFPEGARPSPATLHRWMNQGTRGVVLESISVGGKRFTSTKAIGRFLERLNATRGPAGSTAADSESRLRQARLALDAMGVSR